MRCCSRSLRESPTRGAARAIAARWSSSATRRIRLPVIAEAAWEGRIGHEPRGTGGFGFDPLFIVAGGSRTVAELSARGEEPREPSRPGAGALAARMREAGW